MQSWRTAYDIPLQPFGRPLQPYIGAGAGAGYGWLNFNNAHGNGTATFQLPNNNTFGPGLDLVSFGSAGAFAYQAFAGVSLPLQFLPGLAATLDTVFRYRPRECPSHPRDYDGRRGEWRRPVQPDAQWVRTSRQRRAGRAALQLRHTTGTSRRSRPGLRASPGDRACPVLPGVLRLGQGDAHRPRPPDHFAGGVQQDESAIHSDRGERLHGHLGHTRNTTKACRCAAPRR